MTIKVGDTVRVKRKTASCDPNGNGNGKLWDESWIDERMKVGDTFIVSNVDDRWGAQSADSGYNYPLSVLEVL